MQANLLVTRESQFGSYCLFQRLELCPECKSDEKPEIHREEIEYKQYLKVAPLVIKCATCGWQTPGRCGISEAIGEWNA